MNVFQCPQNLTIKRKSQIIGVKVWNSLCIQIISTYMSRLFCATTSIEYLTIKYQVHDSPCPGERQPSFRCSVAIAGHTKSATSVRDAKRTGKGPKAYFAGSLQAHMNRLLKIAIATSTESQYQKVWKNFAQWLFNLGHDLSLLVKFHPLGLHIAHLDQLGMKPSTIQSHMSAVNYVHKINDIRYPTQSFLINKLMVSLHKISTADDMRLHVTHDILHPMIAYMYVNHVVNSQYEFYLYSAMPSLAYNFVLCMFACLGIQCIWQFEECSQHPSVSNNNPRSTTTAIRLQLESFKHSTPQPGLSCPVHHTLRHLFVWTRTQEPIFISLSRLPITRN